MASSRVSESRAAIPSTPFSGVRISWLKVASTRSRASSRGSSAPSAAQIRRPPVGDAWAHHPYNGSPAETPTTKPPPGKRGQPPTAVTLGNFDTLVTELNRLYRKRVRLWITEYGYQTNPPDRIAGVTHSKQAAYLTQSVAIARTHPQVDLFLWFLLRDEDRIGGWQSGLTTVTGKRKPSFDAFRRATLG